jgi:hypothetical protein
VRKTSPFILIPLPSMGKNIHRMIEKSILVEAKTDVFLPQNIPLYTLRGGHILHDEELRN